MKYVLEKRVRLRPGIHRVFFGLPEENYSATVDIELKDEEVLFWNTNLFIVIRLLPEGFQHF